MRQINLPNLELHHLQLQETNLSFVTGIILYSNWTPTPSARAHLLDYSTLIMASCEIIKIDDFLDVGLHIADELELHIGLEKRAGYLVEAIIESLLVNYGGIAHLLESTRNAPP